MENNSNSGKGGWGCLIVILLVLSFLAWACEGLFDDGTSYHYYDYNGNDKADEGEYRWTEDANGNETPGW